MIWSINRGELNIVLLQIAESHGARLHFDHRLERVDFVDHVAHFRRHDDDVAHRFESLVGADGAGSTLRAEMAARVLPLGERTEWLDHGYELEIPPDAHGGFRIEPNALHIWPRGHYMHRPAERRAHLHGHPVPAACRTLALVRDGARCRCRAGAVRT